MDYTKEIKALNFSIFKIREMLKVQENYNEKIREMLKVQENYNEKIRKDIHKELDLITSKQLDFISDEHLNFISDEHLDFIIRNKTSISAMNNQSDLIIHEQFKFDTGKIQYRTVKRRNQVKKLISEARYTQVEIIEVLMIEFPEYKKVSHETLLTDLRNRRYYKSENFKKLTTEDPESNILSFE